MLSTWHPTHPHRAVRPRRHFDRQHGVPHGRLDRDSQAAWPRLTRAEILAFAGTKNEEILPLVAGRVLPAEELYAEATGGFAKQVWGRFAARAS
jgi:hypothetical protein